MNIVRRNRLRTCGKAIHRMAALFITPFMKAHKVENKYIVIDGKEEEVVPVSEFLKTESKISRWFSESARHVAEVGPMNSEVFQKTPKHIGKLCKDYTIFEVGNNEPQVNELGDLMGEKPKSRSRPSELAPNENEQDNEDGREDYSILQIAY